MGAAQKDWARRARLQLLHALGGVCAECFSAERLEFDCIVPCGDAHHRMDTSARMSFYRAQHRAGNLQVLCSTCNGQKSVGERDRELAGVECPF